MKTKRVEMYTADDNYVKTFNSYMEAARELNCDEATIRKSAKFGKVVLGNYWFIDEDALKITEVPPVNFPTGDLMVEPKKGAVILMLDIETAPLRSYTWGLWKQNVGLNQIISNWYVISWAVKYLGASETFGEALTTEEALAEDDSRLLRLLWEHLDNADVVVCHNGDKFDIPRVNTRMLLNGLMPPSPYKQVDTLLVARSTFGFSSNRLDHLATLFGIPVKLPTTFDLWKECMVGNRVALDYMLKYNKHDVDVLEEVYLWIRPYIKGHPNLDLYVDSEKSVCPFCGHEHISEVPNKYFYTQAVKYKIYRCEHCFGISRAKQGEKFNNKKLISAIPR